MPVPIYAPGWIGRRSDLMVHALDFRSGGRGTALCSWARHYIQSASLHPDEWLTATDWNLIQVGVGVGEGTTLLQRCFMPQKRRYVTALMSHLAHQKLCHNLNRSLVQFQHTCTPSIFRDSGQILYKENRDTSEIKLNINKTFWFAWVYLKEKACHIWLPCLVLAACYVDLYVKISSQAVTPNLLLNLHV